MGAKAQHTMYEAVLCGIGFIRKNLGGHLPDDPEVKDDKTLVTKIDKGSQARIKETLARNFSEIPFWGEEGEKVVTEDLVFLCDPLDGTRAFSCGLATSTVILSLYSTLKKKVVATVIGEVATGRVWSTFGDDPTRLFGERKVRVWQGRCDEQSTIFLDVPHGFTREGRQIFTHEQMAKLFYELRGKKLAIPGSNGLIQALVANGGQKVVSSITTAIGGPWDVCGVKLVLNAGGAARAFSVEQDSVNEVCILRERDPLDVMNYDILICGNSAETVESLVKTLPGLSSLSYFEKFGRGYPQSI